MQGYKDPFNRRCYPWGKENPELIEWYKTLGKVRADNPVFKDGRFEILSSVAGCVAFSRKNDSEAILVISNSNPHPITYYVRSEWCNAEDLLGNCTVTANMVDIEEKSTVILKRK